MDEINTTLTNGIFGVSTPRPFILSEQNKNDLDKIRDECMEKIKVWENRTTTLLNEYQIFGDSWRVKPRVVTGKKPNTLFNSKSGETHRAVETLGSYWLRSLTAADPFFECVADGLNWDGKELTPEQLWSIEALLNKQIGWAHFKNKLDVILRSVANFGTVIAEKPFVSDTYRKREYTDILLRPLILTAFDVGVFDIELSDFIATFDFPTKHLLRSWAKADDELWDKEKVETIISESVPGKNSNKSTDAWKRIVDSKQRAGYTPYEENVFELIRYHGRIETENSVVQSYWESLGRNDDPKYVDFSVSILNVESVVGFHMTAYGNWRSRFSVAHYKQFELEPYGYGVGKIGRKYQRELDVTESRTNDILMMALYSMWKVSKYAGLKASQLQIKPQNIVELEDIEGLQPLRPDIQAIGQSLAMTGMKKEDFRSMVGAYSNLQATITKASATESAIASSEGARYASVHAELISETFVRDYVETIYLNDLNYLDEPIWVASTGEASPQYMDKNSMPTGIGVKVKTVTDKDFRPERLDNILKGMTAFSSIRNNFPPSINPLPYLAEEFFRALALNPRLLRTPMNAIDQMAFNMNMASKKGQNPSQLQNEMDGEMASVNADGNTNVPNSTPYPVPTNPNPYPSFAQL